MTPRLTIPVQWSLTLCLGLFLGFVFGPTPEMTSPALVTPTSLAIIQTSSPGPLTTLSGGLLLRVKFFRDEKPQIVKLIHLDEARLTILPSGKNRIEILDAEGEILYSQFFFIEYVNGDPPMPVDSKTVIFILPEIEGATRIAVITSNGGVDYDIPTR